MYHDPSPRDTEDQGWKRMVGGHHTSIYMSTHCRPGSVLRTLQLYSPPLFSMGKYYETLRLQEGASVSSGHIANERQSWHPPPRSDSRAHGFNTASCTHKEGNLVSPEGHQVMVYGRVLLGGLSLALLLFPPS